MAFSSGSLANLTRGRSAFTLLEMVVVLAIISILGGLGVAVIPTALQNNRKARAAGDLIVIQQGLEAYRAKFGDYPRYPAGSATKPFTDQKKAEYVLNALNGRYGPDHHILGEKGEINVSPMLNNALLVFANADLPLAKVTVNWIIDPWGNSYVYDAEPKNDLAKDLFGYFLYSIGPDETKGTVDDIYAK